MTGISIAGQAAVVTGAGRGIGRSIAVQLAGAGARVVAAARTASELEALAEATPGVHPVPVDVRREADVERLAEQALKTLGRIDCLVNAAGVYRWGPLTHAVVDDYDEVLDTNLKGIFLTCRSVLPSMLEQGGGHIINIASIAGKVGTANRTLYCASKFGVVGLSQALAEEVREAGVRVSVICPGSTNTAFSPKEREGRRRERMLDADDVAHAVRMILEQAPTSFMSELILRPTRRP